ncbi:MAG TPA: hypothetical protein VGR22_09745 [Thermomicrobiales bacterium]|nr:hypothetical protein [Thermomicrobiales bacterium]
MRSEQRIETRPFLLRRQAIPALWVVMFATLAGWVIWRLELFPLAQRVLIDGTSISEPRAFFTVDHPFHTARASLIARSWEEFEALRWVGSHQGGYPAEFFPFGVPAVAALIALLTGGVLEIASAWAVTVAALFLLPAVGYLLFGRHDRLSPAFAFVASAGHVTIASDWTHGGYSELVEWGLATNAAGATYALLALPLLLSAARPDGVRWIPVAAVVITLCMVSNPRSLIAVAVGAIAVIAQRSLVGDRRQAILRVGAVAVLAIGLSAPVILPLLRYSDLYFFLSYQEYDSAGEFLAATVDSVTWPVLVAAVAGSALAFRRSEHRSTQAAAIALAFYVALTALAAALPELRQLIPQLELPRLMPFQRLLTLWLAAYGIMRLVSCIPVGKRTWRDAGAAMAVAAVLAVIFTTSLGPFVPDAHGLREVPRIEGEEAVELIQFREAIEEADAVALPDAAILVLGSRLSWHEQLWAPMVTEGRRFLYNDWLWYWHRLHEGPYDYRGGHFYPNPGDALEPEYLATHGIGAVVVMDVGDASLRASRSPDLEPVSTIGAWDVYQVTSPTGIATLDGAAPDSVAVSDDFERIIVAFEDADPGTLFVHQNWFPRWGATANGESVPVDRGESGYIAVPIMEGGAVEIELTYNVTTLDAIARGVAVASGVVALFLILRPISRWARR